MTGSTGGDASLHIPAGQFCGFWKVNRYSDARVRLVSPQPPALNSDGQGSTASSIVYKEFPVHKMVLEAGSTYFKGLLTTGEDMASYSTNHEAEHTSKRVKIEDSTQGLFRVLFLPEGHGTKDTKIEESSQVIDLTCDSEEDAIASEAVLEFLYNHNLPASPNISNLCKMITAADYLGAELCVKACAISLSELEIDQHSVLSVCNVMDKLRDCPASIIKKLQDNLWQALDTVSKCTDLAPAVMKTLQEALFECLLDPYSDVLTVINNNDLLVSFCSLPLKCIELWGSSDKLKVESENSVVMLLNKWWHSQAKATQTADCKARLSGLVRPAFLSSGYLQYALDKLEWCIVPFPEYKHACSVINKYGVDKINLGFAPYDKLNVAQRCSCSQKELVLEWRIPLERIQQVVFGTTDRTIQGPEGYWHGHTWKLYFMATNPADGSNDSVKIGVGISKRRADAMPDNITASADIDIIGEPFNRSWKQMLSCTQWYADEEMKLQDVVFKLEKHLTDDKHLPVSVKFTNVE